MAGYLTHEDGVAFHDIRFVVSFELSVNIPVRFDGDTFMEGEVGVGMVTIRKMTLCMLHLEVEDNVQVNQIKV